MLMRAAIMALGAIAFVGAGCHSSSHGVAGTGGAAGNAHGDAAGDVAGGGGGATASDGGADARGGSGAGGSGGTTGAGGGSSATDAGSDIVGGNCNTLLPGPGPAVPTVCAPDGGAPPTPSGGTLVPGIYTLTAVTDYGYCDPVFIGQTLALTADTLETAANTTNTGLERANSTFTIAGSNLMAIQTCPEVAAATVNTAGFSVSTAAGVTTLTLISTSTGAITTVLVFTKQ
jgi:hypothetical protein